MTKARIFQHGGSKVVHLPGAVRFEGTDVLIEKRGDEVILKPVPSIKFESFGEIGAYLAGIFPDAESFAEPPLRPKTHERPILKF